MPQDAPAHHHSVRTRDGRVLRGKSTRTSEGGIVFVISDLTDDERLAAELRRATAATEAASEGKAEGFGREAVVSAVVMSAAATSALTSPAPNGSATRAMPRQYQAR